MSIVLDTNVLSEITKPSPDLGVLQFVADHSPELMVTTVTMFEIAFGIETMPGGRRRRQIEDLFDVFLHELGDARLLPLTVTAARRSGQVRAVRRKQGRPIDVADAQIAGIALDHGHSVATRNVSDFDGIGLPLINPWKN